MEEHKSFQYAALGCILLQQPCNVFVQINVRITVNPACKPECNLAEHQAIYKVLAVCLMLRQYERVDVTYGLQGKLLRYLHEIAILASAMMQAPAILPVLKNTA